jgi:hypothetical protein
MRSDYIVIELENVVIVEDQDRGNKSVTNDIQEIIDELNLRNTNKKLVYRDSLGMWVCVNVLDEGTPLFVPVHAIGKLRTSKQIREGLKI